jgi:hypothetical protein
MIADLVRDGTMAEIIIGRKYHNCTHQLIWGSSGFALT